MAEKATQEKYWEATGRRKTAIARVRLYEGQSGFEVNEKSLAKYFLDKEDQGVAQSSLKAVGLTKPFKVSIRVKGGGMAAQAQAVRHSIARALVKFDEELKIHYKALGYLTRDPRMRERKKFGLKRARRARQWRKR
jgi:small subunit ribosomal protein S9